MAARGDDNNLCAFKVTYFLLDLSTIIINIFFHFIQEFPLSAIICGCVKLMSLSRILAILPHAHPPPLQPALGDFEVSVEGGGGRL